MLDKIAACEPCGSGQLFPASPFQHWFSAPAPIRREENMSNATQPRAVETEALKEAYAAFNRNDIRATVEALDPQIEWTEPAEFPGGGTYHGHAEVQAYLSQSRKVWAEGSSEPERFIVAGNKIIVFVHVRVRPKDSAE
jgi:ketosteroid isomerase-like protein